MFWVVVIISLLLAVMLITMVLLQPGKSGGMGGAFGNLGSQLSSTFGSRRTLDMLAKWTTYVALALGVVCVLANAFLIPRNSGPTLNPVTTGTNAAPPAAVPSVPAPGTPAPATQAPAGGTPAPVQSAPVEVQQTPVTPNTNGGSAPQGGTNP